jgi:hypothetical protein
LTIEPPYLDVVLWRNLISSCVSIPSSSLRKLARSIWKVTRYSSGSRQVGW